VSSSSRPDRGPRRAAAPAGRGPVGGARRHPGRGVAAPPTTGPQPDQQWRSLVDPSALTGSPLPVPPALREQAGAVFGDRLPLAERYAGYLAADGVSRGLLGPREGERVWERHLLNCAGLASLVAPGAAVVDVGSGAGLPGLVLALARPDVTVSLLEPLQRRVVFLAEVVQALRLDAVEVLRGRAEQAAGWVRADVVTARAVAPLDRLAAWCLPLLRPGGRVLTLRGAAVAEELATHKAALDRLGVLPERPVHTRAGAPGEPDTVILEFRRRG
jgi:16S rRNA (guanine527-N7)-methyltransferase